VIPAGDEESEMHKNYNTLLFECSKGVARVTLNRPDNANAMNVEFMQELLEVANICDEDTAIRVVSITGNGRYFSVGGDLKAFYNAEGGAGYAVKEATSYFHAALSRFARMKKPLVVAVNGTAAGAGLSLAILGDYVIAVDSAKFTMSYTRAGLSPDGSATFSLPRLIGLRKTKELMLLNNVLSAGQALDWGLINEVVAADKLEEAVSRIVDEFAGGPTLAFGSVRQLLMESASASFETQMEREAREIAFNARSDDGQEGMAAFLEKRQPRFTGK
jgi:2-(1,2-epoxy-1,2-dihydrophenyl)acetyl-CoA isomerase